MLVINLVFLGTLMFNGLALFNSSQRASWLLLNMAYFPVAMLLNSNIMARRVIYMERVVWYGIKGVVYHGVLFLAMLTFLHIIYSITFFAEFYGTLIVVFPLTCLLERIVIKRHRRHNLNRIKVVVVGTNLTARRLVNAMNSDQGFGFRIMGHFDDVPPRPDFTGNYLGTLDGLESYVRKNGVQQIYYAIPGEEAVLMTRTVKIADDNMAEFFYVPRMSRYVTSHFMLHHIGGVPVMAIRKNALNNILGRLGKRTFDVLFSGALLILSPVIYIPVAIAIKCSSPGPVFFKQDRTGYRGRTFKCYKFRTMKVNKEADKVQAGKEDPRKTRVGEFLRKTSIDELPQFINVFKGDMSVVGPRPHMLKHTVEYTRLIDSYMVRHTVKPGITGWAQVNGLRGLTDELWKMERRVECDVWYIENWSFWLDMKIIVRTVMNAVRGEKNAF